jgi:hypothetical protein
LWRCRFSGADLQRQHSSRDSEPHLIPGYSLQTQPCCGKSATFANAESSLFVCSKHVGTCVKHSEVHHFSLC